MYEIKGLQHSGELVSAQIIKALRFTTEQRPKQAFKIKKLLQRIGLIKIRPQTI